jgi:predicted metal-dependent hydrolase
VDVVTADKSTTATVTHVPASFDRPELEIRASTRRTKTGTAHWSGTRIVVAIPSRLRGRERDQFVDELVRRAMRERPQASAHDAALEERARVLSELYTDARLPSSVRFVANQRRRWASCSPATGEIRLSTRLRNVPDWVLDAVLVHELAHLHVVEHSPEFHAIADRHPRQADAELFLDGYQLGLGVAEEERAVGID